MKSFILLSVILLFSIMLYAQRFEGGIVCGVSASQVDGDGLADYNKPGLIAGAFVRTKFNDLIGIQLGMHYIGKGSKKDVDINTGLAGETKIHLDYIETPVLLNIYLGDKFLVEAGVSLGVLLRSTLKIDGYEYEHNYHSTDGSVTLGTQYKLGDVVSVNLRFTYSLVPFTDRPYKYNNVLCLSLFFQLNR